MSNILATSSLLSALTTENHNVPGNHAYTTTTTTTFSVEKLAWFTASTGPIEAATTALPPFEDLKRIDSSSEDGKGWLGNWANLGSYDVSAARDSQSQNRRSVGTFWYVYASASCVIFAMALPEIPATDPPVKSFYRIQEFVASRLGRN